MVAQPAAFEFKCGVAGAFLLHPWRAEVGADVHAAHGSTEEPQQDVDVVTAMTEELATTKLFGAAKPVPFGCVGKLFSPD